MMNLFSLLFGGFYALSASGNAETTLTFEPGNFVDMLGYMGKGMLVIFVIIGIIVVAALLINRLFSRKK